MINPCFMFHCDRGSGLSFHLSCCLSFDFFEPSLVAATLCPLSTSLPARRYSYLSELFSLFLQPHLLCPDVEPSVVAVRFPATDGNHTRVTCAMEERAGGNASGAVFLFLLCASARVGERGRGSWSNTHSRIHRETQKETGREHVSACGVHECRYTVDVPTVMLL